MRPATTRKRKPIRSVFDAFSGYFYRRDLNGLRALFASDADVVYFDNHPGCGASDLDAHFAAVGVFFEHGESTESGTVAPLRVERFQARSGRETALATVVSCYQSAPRPGVRASFVLERDWDRGRGGSGISTVRSIQASLPDQPSTCPARK